MAGGKGYAFDNDLLKLIFNGVPIFGLADNAASSPLTNLYLSLHTLDPIDMTLGTGDQTTNEVAYGGYARKAVLRTSAGFNVNGPVVTLVAAMFFAAATSGGATAAWCAVGTQLSGPGRILYRGPITPNIVIAVGQPAPQLTTGTTLTES